MHQPSFLHPRNPHMRMLREAWLVFEINPVELGKGWKGLERVTGCLMYR
jgi:hypothetical protein